MTEEDIYPQEIVDMLEALSKKKNRLVLKRFLDGPINDEKLDSDILKVIHGDKGMYFFVKHTARVGFTEDNQLAIADGQWELSKLGLDFMEAVVSPFKPKSRVGEKT